MRQENKAQSEINFRRLRGVNCLQYKRFKRNEFWFDLISKMQKMKIPILTDLNKTEVNIEHFNAL